MSFVERASGWGLAGAVAVSALLLLALPAREARADLTVPEAASPTPVITPQPVSSAPALAPQPVPSPAPAPKPPPSGPAPTPEPGQWTPPPLGRNPFDTDRPTDNNGEYPSQLPLPSNDACDRACLTTWSHYLYDERATFLHAVWLNGGLKTRGDDVRDEELTSAIDDVEQRIDDLDKAKTPEPPPATDPLVIVDGPLSGSSDTPTGDTEAGDGGADPTGSADSDSGPSAEPSDPSGASGGGGDWRDEDDPFLLPD